VVTAGAPLRRPILSRTAEYALAAVLRLAQAGPGAARTAEELAAELGVPASYLAKTLRTLAHSGVLLSTRGRGGGFTLATDPGMLPVSSVLAPFGDLRTRHCLLGHGICSDRTACVAHHAWKPTAEAITSFFRETTVAALLRSRDLAGMAAD
jgi:Rrf2 family protein